MNAFDKFFIHFCVISSIIRGAAYCCSYTDNAVLITVCCFMAILGCLAWIQTINEGIVCKKD